MKQTLVLFLAVVHSVLSATAQVTPYTGGEGSGYGQNSSPQIVCPMFFGDSADGHAQNSTPPIICPMFFGGNADGAAQNYSAFTICPSFFGGSGDGAAMDSTNTCISVLPLLHINFYGVKENNQNILYWRAEATYPIRLFELEKSVDGRQFTTTGTIPGSTQTQHLYTYIDRDITNDVLFYRLKILESSGTISYSQVVRITRSGVSSLSVYPNPVKNELVLYAYIQKALNSHIVLTDINGRTVLQQPVSLHKGTNRIAISCSRLGNGIYMLQVAGESIKILINR
jgi:Secretion system C-terminal sorting domain